MAKIPILNSGVGLCFLLFFSSLLVHCSSSDEEIGFNAFKVSSFHYSEIKLDPYDWRYIRVDLPPCFSSMSVTLKTDVDIDKRTIKRLPRNTLPLICFRGRSLPLPDISDSSFAALDTFSNISTGGMRIHPSEEQCHLLEKNITVTLTNEQISPGVWYFGLFNGNGPVRTQSKMISRGSSFSFSGNISVEGCTTLTMLGPYCNQTVDLLSCARSDVYGGPKNLSVSDIYNKTVKNVIDCRNSYEDKCHGNGERKIYSLEILGTAVQLTIMATGVRFNQTPSAIGTQDYSEIILMCYARHGSIPLTTLHDYSGDISKKPLVIDFPKEGNWYFTIQPINQSDVHGRMVEQNINSNVCYSLEWQAIECPVGKSGPNCTWQSYMLQTVLRKNPSGPFESYYLPMDEKISLQSGFDFPLEPLLSNISIGDKLDFAWTYFILDIPRGAAGGNIHIQLDSDAKLDYEIYARFGGLPSLDTWDYYYSNKTSYSNGSMFFKLYDSSDEESNFYILYAGEGTWSFGLKHPVHISSSSQTTMSISVESCPQGCSSQGKCRSVVEASGLTLYSYCSCDRRHGGFDCSVEIVTHKGHIWQSIALIASNAAAILPALWALRQKAFAEWVLFTSSGISSGLYHACDVGTWCILSFHVLQFMDFWLSFMAVVSTFVYLAAIDEVSKRTIHTCVTILTALMAETGATRSANIIIVISIGALGLVTGWLIEFSTQYRSISWSAELCLNIPERWQNIRGWMSYFFGTLRKRFRWAFVLMGFVALSMAAISWKLENSESYWIWHSVWHVTIYTSSFFFLCSKVTIINDESHGPVDGEYELTWQDSFPRRE
ncbi:uncharacterized protein LOC122665353 isoform X1 [Telopea speciosissima]|uniref:uncharacterized protein LOC122665353 isoform X1 n=1 Tax=Telopea speciosissima TaxID=54955 RepID=UPI001CC64F2D|nr:uncharacterized protein LOC122665353 isoform X1 [Telopea speciosissima]